ncbi:MAG: VOC family protein [Verrucomicrobia bacterium]|nr:VOC family protein [Verrucomicrobiota bacterium]
MKTEPIPKGYHTVTPGLTVKGADKVIEFLKRAFDATELSRIARADGGVMHAELKIGDSIVMVCEASELCKPTTASLYLYVNDADTVYRRAVQAGGVSQMELGDQFWGDRGGSVTDPAGNQWWIATHIEDLSAAEIEKRGQAWMQEYFKKAA